MMPTVWYILLGDMYVYKTCAILPGRMSQQGKDLPDFRHLLVNEQLKEASLASLLARAPHHCHLLCDCRGERQCTLASTVARGAGAARKLYHTTSLPARTQASMAPTHCTCWLTTYLFHALVFEQIPLCYSFPLLQGCQI